jgi:signal transduction histidine kinase
LSDVRATTLFRILQESLTNVIRHANATKVRIELYEDASNLVMKITDNGVGIDPNDRNKVDSFGLVGIEERVLALEGRFTIESASDRGTALTIFIPLENLDDATSKLVEH